MLGLKLIHVSKMRVGAYFNIGPWNYRWIPCTKARDAKKWCFLWSVWINCWVNNRKASDLRRHRGHYGVTVMCMLPVTMARRCGKYPWLVGIVLVLFSARVRAQGKRPIVRMRRVSKSIYSLEIDAYITGGNRTMVATATIVSMAAVTKAQQICFRFVPIK